MSTHRDDVFILAPHPRFSFQQHVCELALVEQEGQFAYTQTYYYYYYRWKN